MSPPNPTAGKPIKVHVAMKDSTLPMELIVLPTDQAYVGTTTGPLTTTITLSAGYHSLIAEPKEPNVKVGRLLMKNGEIYISDFVALTPK